MSKALQKAQEVLRDNLITEAPVDVYEVAKNYGIEIRTVDFPEDAADISGVMSPKTDETAIMYVNRADSEHSRAFTVAHNLGHWLLHRGKVLKDPDSTIFTMKALGTAKGIEAEANEFAAELLVPRELLRAASREPVSALSDKFGTLKAVIGYQKKALENEVDRSSQTSMA